MNGPTKNRLHDYEAGWLTLLLEMAVAEKRELRDAQNRVAQKAVGEREGRRQKRKRHTE